ncbi:galactokinase [Marinitoga piezophila KA3]|uniref:Galactokinase n=1 Tax=Marinitoga piezophila (strain DSM 14283 / JCM 11233 / KA3) TaxID=443254 RepID=H2J757_MARPK|nr:MULTISPECIES: galactokinase [Marinitoga]AEX86427.1 galactokinase [Marinitoga piezophila KA3]
MIKYRSPGRINIIGEHTDYNDGYVFPFAIDKYIYINLEKSEKFEFYSESENKIIIQEKLEKTNTWADYIIGVIKEIEKILHIGIPPFKINISSTLPIGAGLSSSAALEVGIAYGINDILNLNLSRVEIAEIGWKVENEFIGLRCGIMDQYACSLSKKDNAILLDTYTKQFQHIPLKLGEYNFFIINSGVKHELGNSEYNKRRQECEEVLNKLNKKTFRDVNKNDLEKLNGTLFKRAKHVVEENERVLKTVEALKNSNIQEVGKYLFESHESLKNLYEVSCEETDFIVDFLKNNVLGARMVGGGFGGSILVLSKKNEFYNLIDELNKRYHEKFGLNIDYFEVNSANGVEKIGD